MDHFQAFHGERLTRKIFEDNVTILKCEHYKNNLSITEAIFIEKENRQWISKILTWILLFLLDQ